MLIYVCMHMSMCGQSILRYVLSRIILRVRVRDRDRDRDRVLVRMSSWFVHLLSIGVSVFPQCKAESESESSQNLVPFLMRRYVCMLPHVMYTCSTHNTKAYMRTHIQVGQPSVQA